MKVNRNFLTLLLVALFSQQLFYPQPAYACSCLALPSFTEALIESDAVFQGVVKNVSTPIDSPFIGRHFLKILRFLPDKYARILYSNNIAVDVTNSWKGVNSTFVTVYTSLGGGTCGYDFKTGGEYLFYTYSIENTIWTNICTRTSVVSSDRAKEDLHKLDNYSKLPLINPLERILIIAGVLLFIIIFILFTRYKRSPDPHKTGKNE